MNKRLLQFALLAAVGISGSALAQNNNPGYAQDARGLVVKSGAGLCWRTGFWTPAMATAECDPDLVAKTPVAAPAQQAAPAAPVAPAVKPTAEKVTLSADALFDFDKATLRSEGRTKLDDLANQAKGIKLEVILAVGHADRIGSDKYNQNLSQKRSEAVKSYLVSKGIEANRVYTEGKGEKQPVSGDKCTKMGREHGGNKKLVECLQSDRRVEIEVIGTK